MSKSRPKLELTWIAKKNAPKLEPWIIMDEAPEKSSDAAEMQREPITQFSK